MMRIGLNQLLLDNSERANRFQAKIKKLRKKELECKQIEKERMEATLILNQAANSNRTNRRRNARRVIMII